MNEFYLNNFFENGTKLKFKTINFLYNKWLTNRFKKF